jgi:DHA1 family multidrug resistance protein-like MFS transporter
MSGFTMVYQQRTAINSAFWILCIMGFFAILSSTMSKSPVLKPLSLSLGTPTDWVGFVAAASTIPGVLISLPAASLSDIFGRKRFLLIAGFVFASAPVLYLLVSMWWQLILVRFYHGFATGIFVPVAEASVAELFPTMRGERISLFSSTTYVGRVIAPLLGGYILFVTMDNFYIVYLAVSVTGVTALILGLIFLVEKKQAIVLQQVSTKETIVRMFQGWKDIIKNPGVFAISFVQACLYYVYGSVEFYLAGYLPEVVHMNKFMTGVIITSIIGVAIFTRPYMGRISDKIGRRTPIVLGCIISGLPLMFIPLVSDFWVLLSLAMVYGFGFATVTASAPALISEIVPKDIVGTSMGFFDTVMDVGQTIGPIICGLILATSLQYTGLFFSLTFILLLSCLVFILFNMSKKDTNNILN